MSKNTDSLEKLRKDLYEAVKQARLSSDKINNHQNIYYLNFHKEYFAFKLSSEGKSYIITTTNGRLFDKTSEGDFGAQVDDKETIKSAIRQIEVAQRSISKVLKLQEKETDLVTFVEQVKRSLKLIADEEFELKKTFVDKFDLENGVFVGVDDGVAYVYNEESGEYVKGRVEEIELAIEAIQDLVKPPITEKINQEALQRRKDFVSQRDPQTPPIPVVSKSKEKRPPFPREPWTPDMPAPEVRVLENGIQSLMFGDSAAKLEIVKR